MQRIVILLLELCLVAVAVFIADQLQASVKVIPKWLINLPEVEYSRADFWTVFRYFLAVHAVLIGLLQWTSGPWRPAHAQRTVTELFGLAVAFACAALLVFVTTTVAFDPQFVVGIFLVAALALLLIHLVAALRRASVGRVASDLLRSLLRRTFSLSGLLAIALALSPGILAKAFVSNRDVANVITQIRISLGTDSGGEWAVENAVGGLRFRQPIEIQFAPGVRDTMYVLERQGRLLRVPWRRAGEPEMVLDIAERVGEVDVENGALGFDLHPQYGDANSPNGGFVYLYYTSVLGGEQLNRLSRFDLAAGSVDRVGASELVLIEWDRNESGFHNGGSVEFGPDGFLYIAVGEMSDNDAHQRIDRNLVAGVLRIDVDRRGGDVSQPAVNQPQDGRTAHYFIPRDNPFVGLPGALEEYYAIGLRNPFRIAFDPADGSLWAGDVGSTVWEEVNRVEKGGNYQYPFIEGLEATGKPRPEPVMGNEVAPVYQYHHTAFERAVIGGVVYRGQRYPGLQGKYLFGDNYSGNLYALPASARQVDSVQHLGQANQFAQRGITSFTTTPDGEILLTTLGSASGSGGEIIRLLPRAQAQAVQAPPAVAEVELTPAQARGLFNTNCARCHGSDGRGDGPDAAHLGVAMADFGSTDFQSGRSDEQLYIAIDQGGVAIGRSALMPPWGTVLTPSEMRALVDLVRQMGAVASDAR